MEKMSVKEKMELLSLLIKYINEDEFLTWKTIKRDEISIDVIISQLMLRWLN